MHNHNVIIGARSASQTAPDSVAAMGNECLCSSASIALQSKVHNAVQHFCIGPHFAPKRDIKKVSFKDCFSYETCSKINQAPQVEWRGLWRWKRITPKGCIPYLQISVDLSGNLCDNPSFRIFWKKDKCENRIEFGQYSGDRRCRNKRSYCRLL